MRKAFKKAISILLVAVMVFGAAPLAGFVGLELTKLDLVSMKANAEETDTRGACGENLNWSFDESTGTLTIDGVGKMMDFAFFESPHQFEKPWSSLNIRVIIFKDGVTSIGNEAFLGFSSLETVLISESIQYIGFSAFENCINLANISVLDSVIDIGGNAFHNTKYYRNEANWENNVLYIGNHLINTKKEISGSYTVKSGTKIIADYAFYSCNSLTNLIIPDSVIRIGHSAFESCDSLENITIKNNEISIGGNAFHNTKYYRNEANWENRALYIGNHLINIKNDISGSYAVKGGTKTIADYAFSDRAGFNSCNNLENITIPNGVTHIGARAFDNCSSLESITIPNTIKFIGGYILNCCFKITDIYYLGTSKEWDTIIIENDDGLFNATIHFNSTPEGGEPLEPNEEIKLISSNPANGEMFFSLNDDISLTFNQNIKEVVLSKICIREYETDKVVFTASAECIDINNNTLYLNNLVESPAVDKNGKTIEGVKFKGNMKYYLDIASDAICFNDGYFEGTKSKDDLAFSTYISKDRSLKEYGFKQEYTYLDNKYDFETSDKQKTKYLNSAGEAMATFCVPGLKEEMVPQGLTYYPQKDWYLISAYHKNPDLPSEEKNNSVIYALDRNGNFVAQFNIHTAYGKDCRIHAGGIAVGKYNLYLTYYNSQIAYIPLSELDVPEKTVKDVCIRNSVDLGEQMRNTSVAYLNYSENGVLWTGNFYCPTVEAEIAGYEEIRTVENGKEKIIPGWNTPASDVTNSILLGYKLSGSDSLSEWSSLTKIVKNDGSSHCIYIPNKYDGIQGATVSKGVLYLSRAKWGLLNKSDSSAILACYIGTSLSSCMNLKNKNWALVNNLSGGENIFIRDGKMYGVYEASALNQLGGIGSLIWRFKAKTDVLWKIDVAKMLEGTFIGAVNCPVDVEIYDEETGELVGRIKDNVVDSEVADKDNSVPVEVDGDTKYYWLPANKKYKVVLIGNDTGTMDYSVSLFDENAQLKERANFYDMNLTDGLAYTNEVEDSTSLSQSVLETEAGTKINPDQYFDNMQNAKVEIAVSSDEGGTVNESFSAVSGDKVTVEASAKDGYIFYAWVENDKIVSIDAEYSFVVKNNRNLKAEFVAFSVRNPSTTTIKYDDSIVLHADLTEALPNRWYIEWTASNNNFSYSVSADGTTCTISPNKSGDTTFTATVYDAEGNEICKDEQTMTSKAGFFQKLIAFFKKLFGLTKVIPQAFKGIY